MPHDDSIYVGQAKVLSCEPDGRPRVLILGGNCETTVCDWAIPFRYEPEAGDLLLVLGQAGRYWVTGVTNGKGRSQMAFRGDTEWQAEGPLKLEGNGGMRLDSPTVRIEADEVDTEAEHVVQRVEDMDSEVSSAIEERAGECSRSIDGDDEQTAARHSTVAKHAVKMDGQLLRLS